MADINSLIDTLDTITSSTIDDIIKTTTFPTNPDSFIDTDKYTQIKSLLLSIPTDFPSDTDTDTLTFIKTYFDKYNTIIDDKFISQHQISINHDDFDDNSHFYLQQFFDSFTHYLDTTNPNDIILDSDTTIYHFDSISTFIKTHLFIDTLFIDDNL